MVSLRTRKKVDYSAVTGALSDDEVPAHFSEDSDDFEPEPMAVDQAEEEEFVEPGDALEPESEDEIKQEDEDEEMEHERAPKSKSVAAQQPQLAQQPLIKLQAQPEPEKQTRERVAYDTISDRAKLFFGLSDEKLVQAAELRIVWGSTAVIPEKTLLDTPTGQIIEEPESYPDLPVTQSIPCKSNSPLDPSPNAASLVIDEVQLAPGESRKSQNITLLNTGYFVTDVKWAPHKNGLQYLAIGALTDVTENPINVSAFRPELSPLSTKGSKSQFFIYSFDTETGEAKLFQSFDSFHGPVRQFEWRPVQDSTELAILFQDGALYVVKVPTKKGHYTFTSETDPEKSVLQSLDLSSLKATCFAWKGPGSIIVGTAQGSLAEYVLDDQEDPWIPSFVYPVHAGVISQIASASPAYPSLVFTTSVDGFCKVVDIEDIQHSQAPTNRFRTFSTISGFYPFLDSFLTLEDEATTRVLPLRKPALLQTGTNLTRHEGSVTSIASSQFHPFVISGGIDGSVHIANPIRRVLLPKRALSAHQDATLWTLEASDRTSTYRMIEVLHGNKFANMKSQDKLTIFPKQVTITSLNWVPSRTVSGWYAAGTASGLVRIENLSV